MYEDVPSLDNVPYPRVAALRKAYARIQEMSTDDKLSIEKLVCEVGSENITLQILSEAVSGITKPKKGLTKVTFVTEAIDPSWLIPIVTKGEQPSKTGFILWMDTDLLPKRLF